MASAFASAHVCAQEITRLQVLKQTAQHSMIVFFVSWTIPGLFFFCFNLFSELSELVENCTLMSQMGFKLRTSGVGSDQSTS